MFVCCECCVLSGRGLCDELITRPEESYRLWCVFVCDLGKKNLKNEEVVTRFGSQRHRKINCILLVDFIIISRCTDSRTSGSHITYCTVVFHNAIT